MPLQPGSHRRQKQRVYTSVRAQPWAFFPEILHSGYIDRTSQTAAMQAIKRSVKRLLNRYPQSVLRKEFEHQQFKAFNERPVEFGFVFQQLTKHYPKTVLDVGTGTTALPHLMRNCGFVVTATDNVRDYWPSGMINRHYYVLDDDITQSRLQDSFDAVTCISVLEHIVNADAAMANMFRRLKPGGLLILTCPYTENDYVENVYQLPGSSYGQNAPYVTQSFSRDRLNHWLTSNGAELLDQQYWQFWTGNHWTVGEQIVPPRPVAVDDKHQHTCLLMRKK